MGTYIHLYVERKTGNDWEAVKNSETGLTVTWESAVWEDYEHWIGQNYDLFALLAGVRNFYDIKPIAEPRGLPEDVSATVSGEYWQVVPDTSLGAAMAGVDRYDKYANGYSSSWYTLQELLSFDWEGTTFTNGAMVGSATYETWKKTGKVDTSRGKCRGPSFPNSLTHEEMDEYLEGRCFAGRALTTYVECKTSVATECEPFLKYHLPALEKVGPPDQVRVVFWFDG